MTTAAETAQLTNSLDACLPQTQCRQCGFEDCRAYADAMARQLVDINDCPPGGETSRHALARILGREPQPEFAHPPPPQRVVRVVEADCIGCTKCIAACPLDAFIGAAGLLHGVIDEWCSGCGLCIPVCPTDCIVFENIAAEMPRPDRRTAARWRQRYLDRCQRQRTAADATSMLVELEGVSARELAATVQAAVARQRTNDD